VIAVVAGFGTADETVATNRFGTAARDDPTRFNRAGCRTSVVVRVIVVVALLVASERAVSAMLQDASATRWAVVAGLHLASAPAAIACTWIAIVTLLPQLSNAVTAYRELEAEVGLRAFLTDFELACRITTVAIVQVVVVAAFAIFPQAVAAFGSGDHETFAPRSAIV
jgi:hypothetical protein